LIADGVKIDYYEFKDQVAMPKIRTFEDDKVNDEQIRRIVLATRSQKLKCLLMLMKDTGARPAEILGLKLSDLNLTHDPPCFNIPGHLAKNDIAREIFFTTETKSILTAYLQNNGVKTPEYVFLRNVQDHDSDEERFQIKLRYEEVEMNRIFRRTMARPEFADMNEKVAKRHGVKNCFKIHIYSFKKFAFTRMADTLGELAAHAITGHKAYLMTYYKKSREERAEDYRKLMLKISVFGTEEKAKIREQVEQEIKALKTDELAALLKSIQDGKKAANV
jgi:integrase